MDPSTDLEEVTLVASRVRVSTCLTSLTMPNTQLIGSGATRKFLGRQLIIFVALMALIIGGGGI